MYKSKTMKKYKSDLLSLTISFVVILALVILLRPIRALFPLPEIGPDKIIGYSQYFGYPLSFDTIFFFVLILVPLFVVFLAYLFKKNK
jgi:hypothetical protein